MGKHSEIPAKWRELFALIPGYDPIALAGDCWFDADVADRVVEFFATYLTHIEGTLAGKPLVLERWQQALVGCAFGWKRPGGTRRYREVFQYVPRKNGKSTLLGGLVNLVAFCDGEPGAQIYSAAADREQAALVYRQAKGMILNNPELTEGVRVYATFKSIEYPTTAVYKALSADADTKHGFNTHFVVVDEVHALRNRDLVDVLVTSTGSRTQPMVWYITTADFDRESICNEKYDYALKVRDNGGDPGKAGYDPYFLPCVYEAKIDDDWTSPEIWRKANPNLGVSISTEYLTRECLRAQETPTYENTFKRLHLNIRTTNDVRWLSLEKWDVGDGLSEDEAAGAWRERMMEEMKGRECYAGLDLSTTTDISALSLLFPQEDGFLVLPFFWIPEANAAGRERRDRVPYLTWIRQGFVEKTEGDVIDYDVIRQKVNALATIFNFREIAVDRWNATQITTQLQGDGFEMVPFGQGFASLSAPTKELEKLVIAGKLAHGGNPVLRWMAGNVTCETDAAGNIKPSKRKSTERIDGIAALVNALGRAIVSPSLGSVYESRGVLTL